VASEAECGEQAADYLDYLLNTPYTAANDVAAVFIEPVVGEGGYVVPPPGFVKAVEKICHKNGCLFVVDEVQAGFGRTGKMWSCEWDGAVPDMLVWGKGVGGDQPLTGVTLSADLASKLSPLTQPLTFTANAVACAAALANIEIMTDKNDDLMGRAVIVGEEIMKKLRDAAEKSRVMGEVRGRGFMIGVEFVEDKKTKKPVSGEAIGNFMWMMRDRGVLVFPCGRYGNVMRFMPPLVCTREHFNKAVDIFLNIVGSGMWVK
jgi:4-aminobutyrate aminotransferase